MTDTERYEAMHPELKGKKWVRLSNGATYVCDSEESTVWRLTMWLPSLEKEDK